MKDESNKPILCERFSSKAELKMWLYVNIPIAIKPKSKSAKTNFVKAFASNHAFDVVCDELADKLYKI